MPHQMANKRLSRTQGPRRALLRSLAPSFFLHEKIETTSVKAKEVSKVAERLITQARRGDLHSRRLVAEYLLDPRVVKKLVGRGAPDEAVVQAGVAEFAAAASVLEQSLGTKEYVCGRLTIADFDLTPYAALTASCGLDFQPYPKAKAWLGRMTARDSVKRTLAAAGEVA